MPWTPTSTAKRQHCSPRTIEFEEERLITLKRHFGDVALTAITAKAIAEYQRKRHDKGAANRAINMDVGVLARSLYPLFQKLGVEWTRPFIDWTLPLTKLPMVVMWILLGTLVAKVLRPVLDLVGQ